MQEIGDPRPSRVLRPMQIHRERGIPKTRLYDSIAAGELRHIRFGRAILIRESDLEQWLDRYTVGGNEPRAA
jgi:excisionase family DNA binding protein